MAFTMIQPTIGKQEQTVYDYIKLNPACWRRLIAKDLNLPLQSVCGRVNSLIKKSLVFESGTVRDIKYDTMVKCLYVTVNNKRW